MKQYVSFITSSIASLEFYRRIPSFSLVRVVSTSVSFLFLLALVYAVGSMAHALPQKQQQLNQLIQDTTAQYPPDLVITWKDGQLTTTRPVLVTPYPQLLSSLLPLDTLPAAFFSLQASESAFLTLTPTQLNIASKETSLTSMPLAVLLPPDERIITATTIEQTLRELTSFSHTNMLSLLIGGTIALMIVFFISRLVGLLFEVVFFYFLQRILWGKLSIATTVKYLLAVSIPAELIATIHATALPHSTFPSYSLVLWIYLAVVLLTASSHQSE